MKRANFTDEQIIGILEEHQVGATCPELCDKYGMSTRTFYSWKARFELPQASGLDRIERLENENAKLKKMLVEQMLALETVKEEFALRKVRLTSHEAP